MNVDYELDNSLSILNFVAMGVGCSIVPEYARALRQDGIVYRQLRPSMTRTPGIVKKKGRGGIADLFFRFTLENLGADMRPGGPRSGQGRHSTSSRNAAIVA